MKCDEYVQHLAISQHSIYISCYYCHYLLCYKFLLTLVVFTLLHVPPKFICPRLSSDHRRVFLTPWPFSLLGCPTCISNSQSQNWTRHLSPQSCVTSYIPSLSLCLLHAPGYHAWKSRSHPTCFPLHLLCLSWHLLACLCCSIFTWTYERCSKICVEWTDSWTNKEDHCSRLLIPLRPLTLRWYILFSTTRMILQKGKQISYYFCLKSFSRTLLLIVNSACIDCRLCSQCLYIRTPAAHARVCSD